MVPVRNPYVLRKAGHLGGLDALRFTSVYFIVLSHAGYREFSGFGVPLLMALSGFLVTRQLLADFNCKQRLSTGQFYMGRLLRIAPAYLVFVAMTYVADVIVAGHSWPGMYLLSSLTHTINYYNALNGHPDLPMAHVWTLSVLEQFYLIWPLLFAFFIAHPRRLIIISALILAGLSWRIMAYTLLFKDNISWIYNAMDCRVDSILVGCATAVICEKSSLADRFGNATPYRLLGLVVISGIAITFSNDYKPWHYSFGYLFEACVAMVMILSLSRLSDYDGFKWLDASVFSWLGKLSYPVFLYHILALGLAGKLLGWENPFPRVVLATVIVLIAAMGSYYLIETPILRYRTRLRQKWAGETVN